MPRMIFVNLPVADLERSKAFFSALGFGFDPRFSDESATALVIEEGSIHAMLMTRERFAGFLAEGAQVADATQTTEVLLALSAESREEVDRLAEAALGAGGSAWKEPMDMGAMYGRSFRDPDGHVWEVMWMDVEAFLGQGAGETADATG